MTDLPPDYLDPNRQRTLTEQVEFAYLLLLSRLESLHADVLEAADAATAPEAQDKLDFVSQSIAGMLAKNIRLKHKLAFNARSKALPRADNA